jgi:hypothetical protein
VTVLIRPEQFALSWLASSLVVPAGGVTGTVTGARYHGHDALISVDVAGAGLLQVPALGTEPPADGDEVSLTVRGPVTAWAARPAEAAGSPGPADAENA